MNHRVGSYILPIAVRRTVFLPEAVVKEIGKFRGGEFERSWSV